MYESTTELKQTRLKEAIKELLKRKGHTYSDLAKLLECSIPTAKRIMNKEEISLSRLLLICDWLDVDLGQLEEVASHLEAGATPFTKEQEDFFAESPHFLSYFIRLAEGMSPKEIAQETGISPLANQKYILGLEKIGLIHTTATGRVAKSNKGFMSFRPGGRLARTHYERIIDHSARHFKKALSDTLFSQIPSDQQRARIGYSYLSLKLTEESVQEYIRRIRKLAEDTERISEHERRVFAPSQLTELTLVYGYSKRQDSAATVPIHKDVFGEIVEI